MPSRPYLRPLSPDDAPAPCPPAIAVEPAGVWKERLMEVVHCLRRHDAFLRGERASTCAPDGGYRLVPPGQRRRHPDVGARPHCPGPGPPGAHHGAPWPAPHRMSAPIPAAALCCAGPAWRWSTADSLSCACRSTAGRWSRSTSTPARWAVSDLRQSPCTATPRPSARSGRTTSCASGGVDELCLLCARRRACRPPPRPLAGSHAEVAVVDSSSGQLLLERTARYRQVSRRAMSTARPGLGR